MNVLALVFSRISGSRNSGDGRGGSKAQAMPRSFANSLKLFFLVIVSVLTMGASHAWALSAACARINSDWGVGSIQLSATKEGNYSGLLLGETINYTITHDGTLSGMASLVIQNNGNDVVYSGNGTTSGVINLQNGDIVDISGTIVLSGYIHYTIICSAAVTLPSVTSISPANGSTSGGTAVTITGTEFLTATNVTFGGVAGTNMNVASNTQLTVTTPAGTAGPVDVVVNTELGSATSAGGFSYTAPASLVLMPSTALADGTETMPYTKVTFSVFGGTGAFSYAASGDALPAGMTLNGTLGELTGTPASGTAGTYNITVTATDLDDPSQTVSRSYVLIINGDPNAPTITSISPTSDTTAGGSTITITGTNLGAVYWVDFGGTPASNVNVLSATQVTATVPAHAAGVVNVSVSLPNGGATAVNAFTYIAPTPAFTFSPVAGTLPAGTEGTPYNQTVSATGGVGTITYSITNGTVPAGLTLNPTTGVITGTPTTAGPYNFTVTATDSVSNTGTATYSLTVNAPAGPTISGISPTSGPSAGGTMVVITGMDFSQPGNTPSSIIFGGVAVTHRAFTPFGGLVLDTPPHAAGTVDVSVTVNGGTTTVTNAYTYTPPTFVFSPSAGTLPAGTEGTAYPGQTIGATGGVGAITYTVTNGVLPAGLTLNPTTGAITGTPTTAGPYNFTVTATDSVTNTGTATYSLTVNPALAPTFVFSPSAGTLPAATEGTAYTQSVTATGGTGPYTYVVTTGTLPAGLSLDPDTGAITGTPTAAGPYNFTVTATDSASPANTGTAAYSLTVNAPASAFVFSPSAGTLPVATQGTSYSETVSVTGGTAPYTYSLTGTLPAGLIFDPGTGKVTGTPTTAGTYSFTVTATDSASQANTGAAVYSLTVNAPASTFVFSPGAGSLAKGTVGKTYSKTIAVTGGTAPYSYAVSSGALPAGLSLDAATGKITGKPTGAGTYSFTVTATDSASPANTGTAAYSLTVNAPATVFNFTPSSGTVLKEAMAGEDYSQPISAKGGTGALTYSLKSGALPAGMVLNVSTGELTGPLDADAEVKEYAFTIEVRDASGASGTVRYTLKVKERVVTVTDKVVEVPAGGTPANVNLAAGATGGPFSDAALTFVEPANAGTVSIVNGEFAQAGPSGPLGWYLKFIPNPAYSGTVKVGFRLTSVLGTSNTGVVTYMLAYDPAKVAAQIDGLVHGFVQTRQSLIASSINVPGLLERRQMENATDPVTTRMSPSGEGMTGSFSTSLAQMESARDAADGVSGGYASPFNAWIDGTFMLHNREQNDGRWGSFAMVNLGADYLVSEKALVGLSFHYDRMSDPTDADTELTGNGWMAGPYASFEIGKGVFWDTSLLYGGSANDIDTAFWDGSFDTTRWMINTAIKGEWKLDEATVITPKLRVLYFSETVDDYTVKNAAGDALTIDGFDSEQFRVSLGAEISRSFMLENGSTLTPKLGVTGGFSALDGSGAFGSLTAGVSMQTANEWSLDAGLLFNIEGDGEKSVGARGGVSRRF